GEEEIPRGRRDVLEADPACIEGARLELGGRPTAQGERAQRKRDIRRHAAGYIGERGEEALAAAGIVLVAGAPVVPGVVDEVAGIGLVARGERDVATPPELATVIVEAMAPVELGEVHLARDELEARRFDLLDRKSTRLNSSHVKNSYAVFC